MYVLKNVVCLFFVSCSNKENTKILEITVGTEKPFLEPGLNTYYRQQENGISLQVTYILN